jgi:hypothetical protein
MPVDARTYDESVEYHCQLPDKFVRISHRTIDLGPLGTSSATQWHGFNATISSTTTNRAVRRPSRW